jgi:hypothetical protein
MKLKHHSVNISATLSGISIAQFSTVLFYVVTQSKHQIAMLGKKGVHASEVSGTILPFGIIDEVEVFEWHKALETLATKPKVL